MKGNNEKNSGLGRFARAVARSFGFEAAYREAAGPARATAVHVRKFFSAFRPPVGPRETFEDAVRRFGLSDADIEDRRRAYDTAANAYLVIMIAGLAAVGWLMRTQPLLPVAAWASVVIAVAGGQAYLCALRAKSLRERRLPAAPRALASLFQTRRD
jgi:hypothetical protein